MSFTFYFIVFQMLFSFSALSKSSTIPNKREFNLSEEISPCSDLYSHVCKKTVEEFELRPDRSRHTFSIDDSSERILEFKKSFFSTISDENFTEPREKQLVSFYRACMNEKANIRDEKDYVKKIVEEVSAIKTKSDLKNTFHTNILSSKFSLVKFISISNLNDPDQHDIALMTNIMSLPEKSFYQNKEIYQALKKMMISFYKTIGVDKAEILADSVISLERDFSKSYLTPAQFREVFSKERYITIKQFKEQVNELNAENLFKELPPSIKIRSIVPASFKFLNESLKKVSLHTWKGLYLYHELSGYLDDAYPEFYKEKFEFEKKYFGGPDVRPSREERCTEEIMNYFPRELDYVLYPRFFKNFPEAEFETMIEKIRLSIISSVKNNSWLSKEAKAEAENKILKAKLFLIKPKSENEWNFNPIVTYGDETPHLNHIKYAESLLRKELKELFEKIDHSRWYMGPLTVNAYYDSSSNKFVMPAGILQYPFFDKDQSELENLAAVGMVVGHELGHAIDDEGSKFDAKGVKRNWLNKLDVLNFKKITNPIKVFYKKSGHDGDLTIGENIGDFVGLRAASEASNLNSVDEKRKFFISYARVWCNVEKPKVTETRLKLDPHALGFARVNEPVKHLDSFYEAFSCKPADLMYLPKEKRIKIW